MQDKAYATYASDRPRFPTQASGSYQPLIKLPPYLEFLDVDDEEKKCREFKDNLIKFQKEMGVDNFKVPSIGGKELDLCKLFKAAILRGGSQRVSNNKLWKEIVNQFEIPSSCTSASFTLRNHYNKCLLQFEKKFYQTQSQVGSNGLTVDGIPPLQPGVSHIIEPRPNFEGRERRAGDGFFQGEPTEMSNDTGMPQVPSHMGELGQKNQFIGQQADALYAKNTKALYPLAPSIAGNSFDKFQRVFGSANFKPNSTSLTPGLYGPGHSSNNFLKQKPQHFGGVVLGEDLVSSLLPPQNP